MTGSADATILDAGLIDGAWRVGGLAAAFDLTPAEMCRVRTIFTLPAEGAHVTIGSGTAVVARAGRADEVLSVGPVLRPPFPVAITAAIAALSLRGIVGFANVDRGDDALFPLLVGGGSLTALASYCRPMPPAPDRCTAVAQSWHRWSASPGR